MRWLPRTLGRAFLTVPLACTQGEACQHMRVSKDMHLTGLVCLCVCVHSRVVHTPHKGQPGAPGATAESKLLTHDEVCWWALVVCKRIAVY